MRCLKKPNGQLITAPAASVPERVERVSSDTGRSSNRQQSKMLRVVNYILVLLAFLFFFFIFVESRCLCQAIDHGTTDANAN